MLLVRAQFTLTSLCLAVLAGCNQAPRVAANPPSTPNTAALQLALFGHPEVDEAANAYASTYAQAVTASLQAGRYLESLAYRQANAESCLTSRVHRLLGREITTTERSSLMKLKVSDTQIAAYQTLSHGYYVRANGLEMFSCDHAGLRVSAGVKY